MKNCTLQFHLDPHPAVYRWSERVRGEVVVTAQEPIACSELSIRLNWSAPGQGNHTEGTEVGQHLVPGRWEAGKVYRYPFEMTVPVGPPTSSGRLFDIRWLLVASADVGLVATVTAAQEIRVGRADRWDEAGHGRDYMAPEESLQKEVLELGCGVSFAIIMMAVGSLLLWSAAGVGTYVWKIVFGIGSAGLGVFCLVVVLKRGVAAKRLGHPEVHISSASVCPGDTISVSVRLVPRAPVSLGLVMAHFRGAERAESVGNHTRRFEESLANQSVRLLPAGRLLGRGEVLELRGEVHVPRSSRATFRSVHKSVAWWIDISVAIDGWPNWERRFPIAVQSLPLDEAS